VLRRDLQVVEDCNNSFIDDLNSEILSLHHSLSDQGMKQQEFVWEKSNLERELKDQNQRLSKQLAEAGEREAELRRAIQSLIEKGKRERSNLEDHFTYIDSLRGEISLTLDNKAELEKHVSQLVKEKESLSDSLDYSVGEIFSLEKQQIDQENLLRSSEREHEDLKALNQFLVEKLEAWSFSRSSSQSFNPSIFSELDLFASDNERSPHRR
jgi:chromosome segregation ATPase